MIISLAKDDVKKLKVKLHKDKYLYYIDFKNKRVSEFYSTKKQGEFQVKKIKSAFNRFDTWEVNIYDEKTLLNLE